MAGTKSSCQKKSTCMFVTTTALMTVLKWTTDIISSVVKLAKERKNQTQLQLLYKISYSAKITKKNKKKKQNKYSSWYWLTKYLQACFLTPVLQHNKRTLLLSSALRIFRTSTNLSWTVFLHLRSRYQSHCFLGQRCLQAERTLLPGTRKRALFLKFGPLFCRHNTSFLECHYTVLMFHII